MSAQPDPNFWRQREVVVTGGAGFLGKAVVGLLAGLGCQPRVVRSKTHDLRDARAAREAVAGADLVIHLAARVGGIGYNRRNPAPLVYDNLMMALNVFEQCRLEGVTKLVAVCSVCAYPKFTPVPFSEERIWDGYPEESNAPYGLAKKMMVVLADTYYRQYGFTACVPVLANLYGPNDNFDLEDSHVIAALVRKFVEAKEAGSEVVTVWGSGAPSREFLYVDDAARALLLAGERLNSPEPVNIGTGVETTIAELVELVAELVGFAGRVEWDRSKPDGQPRRRLDITRARQLLDFEPAISLREGLARTVASFRAPARAV